MLFSQDKTDISAILQMRKLRLGVIKYLVKATYSYTMVKSELRVSEQKPHTLLSSML